MLISHHDSTHNESVIKFERSTSLHGCKWSSGAQFSGLVVLKFSGQAVHKSSGSQAWRSSGSQA